ncbi:hypothetical protein TCAL_12261 [Tigriopus californicus]|uniref:BTB domain-containing protein n=1 Tax=Tigriopus californicus TaxID=6832 RepID=A0A553N9E9_TIGCA|nr:hypothetical protein TCAL_12261 [Tigriopus californicus]|eukprot:TCALIF_12261-PA protein Name:"Similar to btbd6b BTB/POZ domain-containing protein 6-B (Danio rerio)" AED:0.06 eAED:0.06 QI:113/1/1/1/1/1/5/100/654
MADNESGREANQRNGLPEDKSGAPLNNEGPDQRELASEDNLDDADNIDSDDQDPAEHQHEPDLDQGEGDDQNEEEIEDDDDDEDDEDDEEEDDENGAEDINEVIAINEVEVQVGMLQINTQRNNHNNTNRVHANSPQRRSHPDTDGPANMLSSEEISTDEQPFFSPSQSEVGRSSSRSSSHHNRKSNRSNRSPKTGYDWQTTKTKLSDRGGHLLETGLWSDCTFVVGIPPNTTAFRCHKMLLAMASPVFEAMFYGGLFNNEENIKILDVQPEAFHIMLEYIYTDEIRLNSFDLVCDICYSAKKYMLPTLVEKCTKYLWRDLNPKNACRAYEFAKLFDEAVLLEKSIELIRTHTREVVQEPSFDEIELTTLCVVLSQDITSASETQLFEAMVKWATKECGRKGFEATIEKKRACLGEALYLIRYLTLTAAEYANGPAQSGLLSQEESFAILMNIAAPGSKDVPNHMNGERQPRRSPLPGVVGANIAIDVDMSRRYFCRRVVIPEPHCLNTSILDCSVTFTVDKDCCIHGIEVPSQLKDFPENPALELPAIPAEQSDYNELLYAHLLDSEGNRLTYTHFTAKVNWNTMIEINFNRSVCVLANRVYRIGMVLNKVGWYPTGICTRRISCEGSFFTFCVGQPNDTLRDGLIRSIIFSK